MGSVHAQELEISDSVARRTHYFLEETELSYKKDQMLNIIKASTNLGLSILDDSVSGMNYMFFGVYTYSFIMRPVFRSDLSQLSSRNLSVQLPVLQNKYKIRRTIQSVSTLFSAAWLGYLLSTGAFSETDKPTMIGVISQVFATGIVSSFFKSSDEMYLDQLEADMLGN